ncbi:MAG TPA: hypothetical protein VFP60_06180 [Pseudolabrys sp.]|nr:hypothetical protein [Pseudolabrys sp.]
MLLGVYWTLYIEVRFYAMVPVLRKLGDIVIGLTPYLFVAANSVHYARAGHASHLLLYVTYCLAGMQISLWQRSRLGLLALALCTVVVGTSAAFFTPEQPLVF